MFNHYFKEELDNLRDLGVKFSAAHPAIAPMLSGAAADPDVERLLEGVAFLTALLKQRLDDEFPELINELTELIWPHYLRPIPSTTLIAFTPKPTVKQSVVVPEKGEDLYVASLPVEETSCLFRICYATEIHPLHILDATFSQPSGQPPQIRLLFELRGIKLQDWQPRSLRLHLAGDYPSGSDLYMLLSRYLKQIVLRPLDKGQARILPPEFIKPVGFSESEALIPYPSQSFPGYRILQEYFFAPEKFLFLDLMGWERWENRGEGSKFEIIFELKSLPGSPPRVKRESFLLFVSPAINIFPYDAAPIHLDHQRTDYLIRPSSLNSEHYQIYRVAGVKGFVQGTAEERDYVPFELFNPPPQSKPIYHTTMRSSPIRSGFDVYLKRMANSPLGGNDYYLSVPYPSEAGVPEYETLSIRLECTNGALPEKLRIGDICLPTSSSPEYVEFKNIQQPTSSILPSLGTNLLWHLLSHLSLNYLSLARPENLKSLLGLYVSRRGQDQVSLVANRKRIEGIKDVSANPSDRLVSGIVMKGQKIELTLEQDHFASQGDLYLFGCVMDHFLGGYASINSYTKLLVQVVQEAAKGPLFQWPERLGNHPLI